jgi:hypothetical protein
MPASQYLPTSSNWVNYGEKVGVGRWANLVKRPGLVDLLKWLIHIFLNHLLLTLYYLLQLCRVESRRLLGIMWHGGHKGKVV